VRSLLGRNVEGPLLLLGVLLGFRRLKELGRLVVDGRDAKRLLDPFTGLQAVGAGEALGLDSRLALRRDDDFDDAHGYPPSSLVICLSARMMRC
jgi:hypothetical protein